ncbi:hypothetical protein COO91_06945 [Nostoc flagelliforme CCNUN1]|uniref:Uncharacterized protein n=1 Tax=Nostoc flagelliforme CCNUN1 TaxID=2038116 RepID=A0A2K8SZR3_9NOSO|nr:hypothetical protein COO91_06945 [Nostoc flagelliforme CCNUN1]
MESRKEKYFLQPKHKRNVEAAIPCEDAIHRVFFLPIIYIAQIIPSFLGWQLHKCKAILA